MRDYPFLGARPSRTMASLALRPPLREVWRLEQAGPSWNLPVISDGRMFIALGRAVRCFEERSHRELWSSEFAKPPRIHAVWGQELVVNHTMSTVTLLDVATGAVTRKLRWPEPYWALVTEGLFVAEGLDWFFVGRLSDGAVLWKKRVTNPKHACAAASTAETIVIGRDDGVVEGVELLSGESLWQTPVAHLTSETVEGTMRGTPSRVLYLYRDVAIAQLWAGWIVAVSIKNGEMQWATQLRHRITDACLHGDRLYCVLAGLIYCIVDVNSGAIVLEGKRLDEEVPRRSGDVGRLFPILASESHLFAGGDALRVLVFERETGAFVAQHKAEVGGAFQNGTHFVAVDGRLYYGDMGGILHCLEQV